MKIGWKQGSTLAAVLFGLLLASCGYQAASVPQVIRDYELVTGCRLKVLPAYKDDQRHTQLSSMGCKPYGILVILIPADGDAHDDWLDDAQPMEAPYGDLLWKPGGECPYLLVDLGTVLAFSPGCDLEKVTADLRRFATQMRLALK